MAPHSIPEWTTIHLQVYGLRIDTVMYAQVIRTRFDEAGPKDSKPPGMSVVVNRSGAEMRNIHSRSR